MLDGKKISQIEKIAISKIQISLNGKKKADLTRIQNFQIRAVTGRKTNLRIGAAISRILINQSGAKKLGLKRKESSMTEKKENSVTMKSRSKKNVVQVEMNAIILKKRDHLNSNTMLRSNRKKPIQKEKKSSWA